MRQLLKCLEGINQANIGHGGRVTSSAFPATSGSHGLLMTAPTLAWGEQTLYRLPGPPGHVFGREFELLPAGTMFAANVILHGVIGVEAEPEGKEHCYIKEGSPLLIIGARGTETRELNGYTEDIVENYRIRQLQDAQG